MSKKGNVPAKTTARRILPQVMSLLVLVATFLAPRLLSQGPVPSGSAGAGHLFAAIDFTPVPGKMAANRERLAGLVREAGQRGARYVVLPELALTGDLAGASAIGEPVPGPTTDFFSRLAASLDLWLVFSVLEEVDPQYGDDGAYYLTSVLVDHRGELRNQYRKILVRRERQDGQAERGDFREIVHTLDDAGHRVGIMSGDDLQVGVARLANLGAETILITAGWSPDDPLPWQELSRQMSQEYGVNLVIANRRQAASGEAPPLTGGIFTRGGAAFLAEGRGGEAIALASLPPRKLPWAIGSELGLPASVPVPAHEPATPELAELGRQLFFDTGLSSTGTVSCRSCHHPDKGFTNGLAKGVGVHGRTTRRNVPTLLNVAFRPLLRWDGYASMLENFVKYPLSGYDEMDFHYLDKAVAYVRSRPDYAEAFRSVLGVETIEFEDIARALSTYQRTLISANSPFDRYAYAGEKGALSESERRGLALFTGRAGCADCHLIGEDYALFMDFDYHFLGVSYASEPGVSEDIGLGGISTNAQAGLFLTPSLRNVALTAPYMHDGSFETLEAVIDFYDRGGYPHPDRRTELLPLSLSPREKADLVAFLRALTGDHQYTADGLPVPEPLRPRPSSAVAETGP